MSKTSFTLIILLNISFLIISFSLSLLNFNKDYDINYIIIAIASSISFLIPTLSIFRICYSYNIDILNSLCGFKLKKKNHVVIVVQLIIIMILIVIVNVIIIIIVIVNVILVIVTVVIANVKMQVKELQVF